MSLTRNDVERVALLARLELSGPELDRMTLQLDRVVRYVEQLSELNTADVDPMAHPIEDVMNVLRGDEVRPSLDRADALSAATKHDREFYLVPAVLGES